MKCLPLDVKEKPINQNNQKPSGWPKIRNTWYCFTNLIIYHIHVHTLMSGIPEKSYITVTRTFQDAQLTSQTNKIKKKNKNIEQYFQSRSVIFFISGKIFMTWALDRYLICTCRKTNNTWKICSGINSLKRNSETTRNRHDITYKMNLHAFLKPCGWFWNVVNLTIGLIAVKQSRLKSINTKFDSIFQVYNHPMQKYQ